MTDTRARVPGPDHPITIERNPARVVVVVAGRIIADTCDAVTLREASYAAVQYVPRKDVDMSALERTATPMPGYQQHEVGAGYLNAYEAVSAVR